MNQINIDPKYLCLMSALVKSFVSTFGFKKPLHLWISNFDLFSQAISNNSKSIKVTQKSWIKEIYDEIIDLKQQFDFIFGDLPFWIWSNHLDGAKMKSLEDELIFQASQKLVEKWFWIFTVGAWFFYRNDKKALFESLERQGLYINACFNLPEDILAPFTSLQIMLILISAHKSDSLFISEVWIDSHFDQILLNFQNENSSSLSNGIFTPTESFRWFSQFKIHEKINKLSTIYSEFDKHLLSDIGIVVALKDDIEIQDVSNSIFFPNIWNSLVIADSDNLVITQKNYYQVRLNPDFAIAEYVAYFFRSELGDLIRSSLVTWETISHIKKSDLLTLEFPLPDLPTQKKIVDTYRKLNELKEWITEIENELSINPITSWILEEMKNIEESIWRMKKHDFITSLILRWESKTLEFKKCLGSIKEQNSNWYNLTEKILQTICAFLNTDGWVLLIWVEDKWSIFGVENDTTYPFKSKDDYLKYLHNLIMRWIWWDYMQYINYDIELVNTHYVLIIQCEKSNSPVYFLKDDKFYIRTNPATDELKSRELVSYVNNRFWK